MEHSTQGQNTTLVSHYGNRNQDLYTIMVTQITHDPSHIFIFIIARTYEIRDVRGGVGWGGSKTAIIL